MPIRLRSKFVVLAVLCSVTSVLADYHLERISPVLNQPSYITQAPGDPTNILYYTTRIASSKSGFGSFNTMGKVWRYDLNTRISTEVLIFTNRTVTEDTGLQAIAFHPDFTNSAATGYGKLYVSSADASSVNRVEEFTLLEPDGMLKDPTNAFNTARVILRYQNNAPYRSHTISWIGFDPNAVDTARNYLYILTGDGSHLVNYTNQPSQKTNDVRGKFLRVDISGADDYPGDTNKNFAVPPSNPIPAYNAANPGSTNSGLGEIYVTGVRNGWRAGFDRSTSDLYWGDVGEDSWEEVNFLKADTYALPRLPVDYGWPQLEGRHNSPVSGAPHATTNPFTGVISYYPIREYSHSVAGATAVGGYVYRGPIPELQGKYFYADFVNGKIWMLDFNRNTDPNTFFGTNGTLTDVTVLWNQRVVDLTDDSYGNNSNFRGLDHIVSFGEDNEGNLYLVDFGVGGGFDGQYTAGAGELFKVVPGPVPTPKLNWAQNGSTLQISWAGNLFRLQAQTNGASTGLSTNWGDYPDGLASPVNVRLDSTRPSVFFRLRPR